MKRSLTIILILLSSYVVISCSNAKAEQQTTSEKTEEKLVDYDLTSYGIPAIIKAPENSKIKKGMGPASVNVDGGNGFLMLVLYKGVKLEGEIKALKEMASDKDFNPTFEAVEIDEPSGFVCRYTGGEKAFAWGVNLGDGGCVYIKDDMMAIMAMGKGKTRNTGVNVDRIYAAAKLMKGTK